MSTQRLIMSAFALLLMSGAFAQSQSNSTSIISIKEGERTIRLVRDPSQVLRLTFRPKNTGDALSVKSRTVNESGSTRDRELMDAQWVTIKNEPSAKSPSSATNSDTANNTSTNNDNATETINAPIYREHARSKNLLAWTGTAIVLRQGRSVEALIAWAKQNALTWVDTPDSTEPKAFYRIQLSADEEGLIRLQHLQSQNTLTINADWRMMGLSTK